MLFLQSLRGKSSLFASYACTASSLYTYSQERDFCFSLVSSPWPSLTFPSFNLIPRLSDRAHKKNCLPTLSAELFLPISPARCSFFSRYTRHSKFLRPPVYPPDRTAENYLASPPRFSSTLAASWFFFTLARSLCFANFFSQLFRDLSHLSLAKWHFLRLRQLHAGFPPFNSRLRLWIFYTQARSYTFRRIYFPDTLDAIAEKPKDILLSTLFARRVTTSTAKSTKFNDGLSLLSRDIESLDSTLLVLAWWSL